MVWTTLIAKAQAFDPALLNLAFVFLMLGYGTKVGLAPLHAWLPDAHAEGPTPISAVLSGLLLNIALYAVLRFKMLLAANPAAVAPGPLMITMGLVSLIFAAFMLYRRRDIKRLFAYSSIEHMGIIAFAFGMGGPLANFAGLLHMTMHSLTKSAIFFSVGHIAQVKGTQKIADIRGLTVTHPVLGWTLVAGVVAIAGLPPFGIFTSEFLVVSSTFARQPLLAIPLVFGLLIAFGALLLQMQGMAFGKPSPGEAPAKASYLPMFAHLSLVLVAGVFFPPLITQWFQHVARLLGMTAALQVDADGWRHAIDTLVAGRRTLLGLWGEPGVVRMATQGGGEAGVVELACPSGAYPSVGARHAPAIRLERALADLTGLTPGGALDQRPWLDHGRWAVRHPLGKAEPSAGPAPYRFLAAEGESLHQIPVGPVHAGIIEPGHFRFTASGETVVRLEARLGYVHRGLIGRMAGADVALAARLAGRASGDSTVAYGLAFARAVESALRIEAPTRAHWLRALMAELERLANHLGDIGAICNDAAFSLMHAHCAVLREQVLRAADAAFGHRLMMDRIVPGGVAADLTAEGTGAIRGLVRVIRERFPLLVDLYDDTASLQDRTVGTGIVSADLVARFGAGGYVGRASGRPFDARKAFAYPPYDRLDFEVPIRETGDVDARVWIRIEEVRQSLGLIDQLLAGLPEGALSSQPIASDGEGWALIEGFRGDVFAWVRIADGKVEGAYLRDPSWFQWPLLEAAIDGNIVADFPLCNKSFNCSYAGVDL